MKPIISSLLIVLSFMNVFAQSAKKKAIEADFDKIFQKIGDLDSKKNSDENSFGLLIDQSNVIINKLKYYTDKYPSAMDQAFKKIGGISSEDGQFRIFSWDTMTGGTQHSFENVIQYRSGAKMGSIVDSVTDNN